MDVERLGRAAPSARPTPPRPGPPRRTTSGLRRISSSSRSNSRGRHRHRPAVDLHLAAGRVEHQAADRGSARRGAARRRPSAGAGSPGSARRARGRRTASAGSRPRPASNPASRSSSAAPRGEDQHGDRPPPPDQLAGPVSPDMPGSPTSMITRSGARLRHPVDRVLRPDEPPDLEPLAGERRQQRANDGVLVLHEDEASARRDDSRLHDPRLRRRLRAVPTGRIARLLTAGWPVPFPAVPTLAGTWEPHDGTTEDGTGGPRSPAGSRRRCWPGRWPSGSTWASSARSAPRPDPGGSGPPWPWSPSIGPRPADRPPTALPNARPGTTGRHPSSPAAKAAAPLRRTRGARPSAAPTGGGPETTVDPTASAWSRPRGGPGRGPGIPPDIEHEFGANDDD